jgi:hypothetical protein
MIKTSRSVQMVLAAATLASTFACSSGTSGPKPIGSGGSGVGVGGGAPAGGGDPGASGGAASTLTNPIPFIGAWTPLDQNAAGIQGAFYILEDSAADGAVVPADGLVHSDFDPVSATDTATEPSKFDDGTTSICISGTAAQVTDPANPATPPYDKIWGGGIGMNLSQDDDGGAPMPFDASAKGITGFEFKMTGDVQSATIRFKATQAGLVEDFCAKITILPGQPIQVRFADLTHMCWGTDGTMTLDVTQLEAIQWQIVTGTASPYNITNFCVTELGYLTD